MSRSLIALGLVGLLASVVVLSLRWPMESAYRDVEIVLDGPDWETMAIREGKDPLAVFAQARAHGATAVAVYERTIKRMAASGEVSYRSGGQVVSDGRAGLAASAFRTLLASGAVRPGGVYIVAVPELLGFLDTAFTELTGASRVRRVSGALEVAGSIDDLEEAPLGYLQEDVSRFKRVGLRAVLRLRNYSGLTAVGLRAKMARLGQLGTGYPVVFEQTEVLGYEGLLEETAAGLRAARFPYARIDSWPRARVAGDSYSAGADARCHPRRACGDDRSPGPDRSSCRSPGVVAHCMGPGRCGSHPHGSNDRDRRVCPLAEARGIGHRVRGAGAGHRADDAPP